jgi:hypothetical protein
MSELALPGLSKRPPKAGKGGFGLMVKLCIGGVLAMLAIGVLWAAMSKGSKVDDESVIAKSAAPRAVPIAKAGRETLRRTISLYGEFKPYQEILLPGQNDCLRAQTQDASRLHCRRILSSDGTDKGQTEH